MYWAYKFVDLATNSVADTVLLLVFLLVPLEFRWDRPGGQPVIVTVIILMMEGFVFRSSDPKTPRLRGFNNLICSAVGMRGEAGAPVNNCM